MVSSQDDCAGSLIYKPYFNLTKMKIFNILLFLIWSFAAISQITGKVSDTGGEPLIGVNVTLKGSQNGTTTDLEGQYTIFATGGTLVFSYIGYGTKEEPVHGRKVIDVTLEEQATTLENVVVIGYGSQKKKELTSAVVVVDENSIKDRPMVSAAEALQGKAAGVQVVQPSGKPGGDIAVRVRGATSVLAGNEPLYVVDGFPTPDIRGLNPADIESMTVLKDASSSAIYGARAANGVVLITTRRGKANESGIQFNVYNGFSLINNKVDVLTTRNYRDLMNEIAPGSLDPTWTNYTNWNDKIYGVGRNNSYQLSFNGGSENTKYLLSANYLQNKGIIRPSQFERYSLRLNLDNNVRSWLTIGTSINALFTNTKNTQDNASSGRGGVILSALNTPPFLTVYKRDGSGQYDPNPFQPSWENPIAYMEGPDELSRNIRLFGNINARINFTKNLSFQTNFGTDLSNNAYDYYLDPFRTNFGRDQHGIGVSSKSGIINWLSENTIRYAGKTGKHNYSVLAGTSTQKQKYNESYIRGTDFPDDTSVRTLNSANSINASSTRREWALQSFFGRITYDFDSRYLFTASLRRDGSSKLAKHWGTMPSLSAAWRISAEPFMKEIKAIDDLKLRAGWGRNGNQEGISEYARYGLINYYRRTATSPLSGPSSVQVTYGNPDLKWETTDQYNIGMDLLMYNGRLAITADAYLKKTKDVLLDVQLSTSLPISSIQTNAGNIQNKGLDISVTTVNVDKTSRKLRWSTEFNISFNRNKVTALRYTDVYYFGRVYSNNQDVTILKAGLPLGSFFGYVSEGVDPDTGNIVYKDINGNGIFDPGDRTIIGNAQPDFVFGLTNNIQYRNWNLNFFFQGSIGNDVFNATRIDLEGMFDSKNQSVAVLNRWTPDNRITDIPKAVGGGSTFNVYNSSRLVEDGTYIRLKALTLSYDMQNKFLKKTGIQNLKLYTTGQNLLTFTKYSGFDPEVNAFGASSTVLGVDYGTYPQSMTVTAGINVQF